MPQSIVQGLRLNNKLDTLVLLENEQVYNCINEFEYIDHSAYRTGAELLSEIAKIQESNALHVLFTYQEMICYVFGTLGNMNMFVTTNHAVLRDILQHQNKSYADDALKALELITNSASGE